MVSVRSHLAGHSVRLPLSHNYSAGGGRARLGRSGWRLRQSLSMQKGVTCHLVTSKRPEPPGEGTGWQRPGRACSPIPTTWIRLAAPRFLGLLASVTLCLLAGAALAGPSDALLDRWISAQTNLHTWTADCTQTRSLKVLSQPLVAGGKVWVSVPDRFRWELGQPAQTVVLRQPDHLLIIYPRLKRVEKYPLRGVQPGPWKDALALLEASFPRSRADLESRFRVSSVIETNSMIQVTLQPRSASARKFMAEIQVNVNTNGFSPLATELRFSDGSSMRNDFTNVMVNAPLEPGLFDAKLDPGFTVVEPLRQ